MISKKLMYYHVGAFGLFALSSILLLIDLHKTEIFKNMNIDQTVRTRLSLSTEFVVILLIAISELPIIGILSSLVKKGEEEVK